jgi:hypothetical protein
MSRPASVRIGWEIWKIRWLDEAGWKAAGASRNAAGLCKARRHEIWIRDEHQQPCEDELRSALLHEIMHACIYHSGASDVANMVKMVNIEELYVATLAPSLLGVLRANPDVRAYLVSGTS